MGAQGFEPPAAGALAVCQYKDYVLVLLFIK
jgi:hypothetical protein